MNSWSRWPSTLITGAPEREERLRPRFEHPPRREVLLYAAVLGGDRHEAGELDRTGGVDRLGERGRVGGLLGGGELASLHRPRHQGARSGEVRLLRHLEPEFEAGADRLTDGQPGVPDGDPFEPVGVLGGHPQPDQSAPVLREQRGGRQLDRIEEPLHPGDVRGVGVGRSFGRFVGAAEPDEVGCDTAQPGVDQERDHAAVQVAPRGFAVQEQHRWAVGRTFVDVGDPEAVDVDVLRFVGEVVEPGETIVGRADEFDAG